MTLQLRICWGCYAAGGTCESCLRERYDRFRRDEWRQAIKLAQRFGEAPQLVGAASDGAGPTSDATGDRAREPETE